MPIDPDFREDPSRAIFLTGQIDEDQVYRQTPVILRLRGEGPSPITVYVDSPGGDVRCARNIRRLLKSVDQDGKHGPRMITVVRNIAGSAAADLLALGDYAIAHNNALVWYHGTRQADREITWERANEIANNLERTNASFALRLARASFRRQVFNFGNMRPEFQAWRQKQKDSPESEQNGELECYANCLAEKLSPPDNDLPLRAFREHMQVRDIVAYVAGHLPEKIDDLPKAELDVLVMKHLLDYRLVQAPQSSWSLDEGGLKGTVQDFTRFLDYIGGEHRKDLDSLTLEFGPMLLLSEDWKEYTELKKSVDWVEKERLEWLQKRIGPILTQLWYFTVSMCRLLQRGEHPLSATDAYWLSIVDEVVGAKLPNLRLAFEAADEDAPKTFDQVLNKDQGA